MNGSKIWAGVATVVAVVEALVLIHQAEEQTRLAKLVASYEAAKFAYEASIENGNLVVRNVGDRSLEPRSMRAIPVFGADTSLARSDAGITMPLDEAVEDDSGSRIFNDIALAICELPKYIERCRSDTPTQLTVVFEFNGQESRSFVAF